MNNKEVIAKGSQSFAKAAQLFDADVRHDVLGLYAWCRHCDDVIDGQQLGHDRRQMAPAERQRQLDSIARATSDALADKAGVEPVFAPLPKMAARHGIDHRYFLDLIEGFRLDVEGARYRTLNDTMRYCYHVAGAVGLIMARIMGAHHPLTLDRACDLGLAFQLTNIARDLVEDARNGHVYAPLEWLEYEGLTMEGIANGADPDATLRIAHRLVDAAAPYYRSAFYGAMQLPLRSAWAIVSAIYIYRDIGRVILKSDILPQRAYTSAGRKKWRVLQGLFMALYGRFPGRYLPSPARDGLWQRLY